VLVLPILEKAVTVLERVPTIFVNAVLEAIFEVVMLP
jgi:hypothetical protein